MNRYSSCLMMCFVVSVQASERTESTLTFAQIPKYFAKKMYNNPYTNKTAWKSILFPRQVTFTLDSDTAFSPTAREQILRLEQRANNRRNLVTIMQEEDDLRQNLEFFELEEFFQIQQMEIDKQLDTIDIKYGQGLPKNQLRCINYAEFSEIYELLIQRDTNFKILLQDNRYRTLDLQKRIIKIYILQNRQKLSRKYFLDDLIDKFINRSQSY